MKKYFPTRAVKYAGGSANNAGSVDYEYCLSCDGALSKRLEYGPGSGTARGTLLAGLRYEYDGLNVLRVDGLYDNDSNGLETNDAWRLLEANTHRPGSLGALLAKRVYEYPSGTSGTSNGNEDYYYGYDPVGNVTVVFDSNGDEVYHFTQDAFGNELPANTLGGTDWDDAREAGVTEHQTGKWVDEFTGLYYFHARWYDGEVGRFTGRDPVNEMGGRIYSLSSNNPTTYYDPTGRWFCAGPGCVPPQPNPSPPPLPSAPGVYRCCRPIAQGQGIIDWIRRVVANSCTCGQAHCWIRTVDGSGRSRDVGWNGGRPRNENTSQAQCTAIPGVTANCINAALDQQMPVDYGPLNQNPLTSMENCQWWVGKTLERCAGGSDTPYGSPTLR